MNKLTSEPRTEVPYNSKLTLDRLTLLCAWAHRPPQIVNFVKKLGEYSNHEFFRWMEITSHEFFRWMEIILTCINLRLAEIQRALPTTRFSLTDKIQSCDIVQFRRLRNYQITQAGNYQQ